MSDSWPSSSDYVECGSARLALWIVRHLHLRRARALLAVLRMANRVGIPQGPARLLRELRWWWRRATF